MNNSSTYLIHNIDPIAFHIFSFPIYWYALTFLLGFYSALRRFKQWLMDQPDQTDQPAIRWSHFPLSDFAFVSYLGVVVGGRIGSFLFYPYLYTWEAWLQKPGQLIWGHGAGMTFQGGLLGLLLVTFLFARYHGFSAMHCLDGLALAAPRAIFWGRIGNFLGSELIGRSSQRPWAVIFQRQAVALGPRHPSQLYEAFLEGILLAFWMERTYRDETVKPSGFMVRAFALGYACLRIFAEFFREPDGYWQLGKFGLTSGQLLCLPLLLLAFKPAASGSSERSQTV